MKRLIVCCDGTWQDLESPYPGNVVKLLVPKAKSFQAVLRE